MRKLYSDRAEWETRYAVRPAHAWRLRYVGPELHSRNHRAPILRHQGATQGERPRPTQPGLFFLAASVGGLVGRLELDELWAYVGKKQKQVTRKEGAVFGDQYTFIALASSAKAIVALISLCSILTRLTP